MLKGWTLIENVESVCLLHQYTAAHVWSWWGIPKVTYWFWWLQLRGWYCPSVPVSCADFIHVPYFSSVPRENPPPLRTRYSNWWTTSATQLQYVTAGILHTWWHYDCWLTVQTLYTIYILTPERISQGHVRNGRRTTFSWPTLYISLNTIHDEYRLIMNCILWFVFYCIEFNPFVSWHIESIDEHPYTQQDPSPQTHQLAALYRTTAAIGFNEASVMHF